MVSNKIDFSEKLLGLYLSMGDIVIPNNIRFDCRMFNLKIKNLLLLLKKSLFFF